MAQTDADADREFRNMLQRRRNREVTLFGKAHEMSEHNCEVFLVIHHHDDDRYVVYNSEPDDEWPRSYEMIQRHYPQSEINTPKNPQDTLKKALDHHGRLAASKVGKGHDGHGAGGASDPATTEPPSTSTTACITPVMGSFGPAAYDDPDGRALVAAEYTVIDTPKNHGPISPFDLDTPSTSSAAESVSPEVGGRALPQTPANMGIMAPEPPEPPRLGRKRAQPLDFYIPIKVRREQPPGPEAPRTPPPRAPTRKRRHAPLAVKRAGAYSLPADKLEESVVNSPCFMRTERRDVLGRFAGRQ